MFKPARTFSDPVQSQAGQPSIGDGAQSSGDYTPSPGLVARDPVRPTQGIRSWFRPDRNGQSGQPSVENPAQRRVPGSMPNIPPMSGRAIEVWTPYYDRGAAAYVQNFGKVLTNPIGAGVVASHRPQASYGPAAQYFNGILFWANQVIPTSINLQGLTQPEVLAAILGNLNVQAAVRTTG